MNKLFTFRRLVAISVLVLLSSVLLEAPSATAAPSLSITSTSSWGPASGGYLHFVGTVRNDGNEPARFISIKLDLYGGAVLLATTTTYTSVDLSPGETGSFSTLEKPPVGYDHFVASINSSSTAQSRDVNHNFLVQVTNTYTSNNVEHIVGTVTNQNTTASEFVQVIATYYDSANTAVDEAIDYVNSGTALAPGATQSFDVQRYLGSSYRAPSYDHYVLMAESSTPSSVISTTTTSPPTTTSPGMQTTTPTTTSGGQVPTTTTPRSSQNTISETTTTGSGYWMVGADGGVFSFGNAQFYGSTGAMKLNQPIVGMSATPTAKGYWFVASDGGVFTFGDAQFFGSTGANRLNQPIVGMASTPRGDGYWLVARDGGIFAFGSAQFAGSTGAIKLNQPIVGMSPTPTGNGYWLVARDGGIFSFGDAAFYGSAGDLSLNSPIVGMASTTTGKGYWFVAADGGVFTYGDAPFVGSAGAEHLSRPIVGLASTPSNNGYRLVTSNGQVFSYGDAASLGSVDQTLNQPVLGIATS